MLKWVRIKVKNVSDIVLLRRKLKQHTPTVAKSNLWFNPTSRTENTRVQLRAGEERGHWGWTQTPNKKVILCKGQYTLGQFYKSTHVTIWQIKHMPFASVHFLVCKLHRNSMECKTQKNQAKGSQNLSESRLCCPVALLSQGKMGATCVGQAWNPQRSRDWGRRPLSSRPAWPLWWHLISKRVHLKVFNSRNLEMTVQLKRYLWNSAVVYSVFQNSWQENSRVLRGLITNVLNNTRFWDFPRARLSLSKGCLISQVPS